MLLVKESIKFWDWSHTQSGVMAGAFGFDKNVQNWDYTR